MVVDQQMASAVPRTLNDVPGWFFWMDRLMFDTLLTAQQDTPTGHLVELGCFLGKSAIVVGAHRREGERFVVVDLFEYTELLGHDDQANLRESQRSYSALTQQAFERNYSALRGDLPEVVAGLSSSVVEHLPPGSVRFMHVDASHLYEPVRGDIEAAKQLLRPGGLVVFDDIRSEHTPGTAAAIWEAVANDGLVPIALTPNKLYGVFSDPEPYQAAIERMTAADDRLAVDRQSITGNIVIRLGSTSKAREREKAKQEAAAAKRRADTAALDRQVSEAVREAVAADRRDRQAAAARERRRKAQRAAERQGATTPTTLAGTIRRRVARDLAPPLLVRWVRRQRQTVRTRIPPAI